MALPQLPDTLKNAVDASAQQMLNGQISQEEHQRNVESFYAAHGIDPVTKEPAFAQQLNNRINRGLKTGGEGLMSLSDAVARGFTGAGERVNNPLGWTPEEAESAVGKAGETLMDAGRFHQENMRGVPMGDITSMPLPAAMMRLAGEKDVAIQDIVPSAQAAADTTSGDQPPSPYLPPAAAPTQRVSIPGVGTHTAGLRKIQEEIGEKQDEASYFQRLAYGNIRDKVEEVGKRALEAGQAEAVGLAEQAAVQGERAQAIAEQNQRVRDMQAEHAARVSAQKAKIEEYRESARYFNLAPEEVKKYRDTLTDPGSTDEQKTIAKAALARGQEWDKIDTPREYIAAALMTLGAAMGSFGSALTGTPNYALKIAQDAARQKIQRQKDEIARRKGLVTGAVNELDSLTREFGDSMVAENAMMSRELSVFDATIAKLGAEAKSEIAAANAAKAQALIGQEIATLDAANEERIAATEMQALGARAGLEQQISARQQQADIGRQQQALAELGAGAEQSKYTIPGWQGAAVDKTAHKEARAFISDADDVRRTITAIKDLRNNPLTYVPGTEEHARGTALVNRLITSMKGMQNMGANFTEFEQELIKGQTLKSIDEWSRVGPRLDQTYEAIDDHVNRFMETRGFTPNRPTASRPAM